jgi:hypothetical protein
MRFEPKRADGRSYRNCAVDALKDLPPGTVVPYETFATALEVDPDKNLRKIQAAVRAANKILLKLHQRGVTAVPGVGYRVLQAREHVVAASGFQSKANRALGRAVAFYEGTDLSQLTAIERRLHEGQRMLVTALVASHRHLDRRIQKIEDLLRSKGRGSGPIIIDP